MIFSKVLSFVFTTRWCERKAMQVIKLMTRILLCQNVCAVPLAIHLEFQDTQHQHKSDGIEVLLYLNLINPILLFHLFFGWW